MDWILKNKNSLREIILRKAKLLQSRISQSKKTKALLTALFLVSIFLVTISIAHAAPVNPAAPQAATSSSDLLKMLNPTTWFVNGIKWILVQVLQLCGWLFAVAATLFASVIDPANISGANGILNKAAVRDVWIMTRDVLNMTFILILLFSAFCTIFQIDSWNLKKVWLNILINALLVNFSFPIARFFIDVSNVAMYYFINHMFTFTGTVTGSSIMSSFAASSGISALLIPKDYSSADLTYLIASIIFVFTFGVTLLVVAALFVIRLIALTMIVMFAPVGFVGYIFPGTKGYASKWWSNLLSYSFFAPIMIFIMAVSLRILETIKNENFQVFMSNGGVNSPGNMGSYIANAAFYSIPIIILWVGIGVAKSAGVMGADTVVSNGKKFGKWLANAPGHYSGINGGLKQAKEHYTKRGIAIPFTGKRMFGTDQLQSHEAYFAQKFGVPHAKDNDTLKKMGEAAKEHNMADMDNDNLKKILRSGSSPERLAALEQLAKNGEVDTEQLQNVIRTYGDKSAVTKRILDKVKETRPDLSFFAMYSDPAKRGEEIRKFVNGDKFDAKKLNSSTLKNGEFMKVVIAEGKLDQKAMEALSSKDQRNGKIIEETIKEAAHSVNSADTSDSSIKNIQIAHLAVTGELHESMKKGTAEQRARIFEKLNKDNSRNIKAAEITTYANEIIQKISSGKFKEIVSNMSSEESRKALIEAVEKAPKSYQKEVLVKMIDNDPFLKSFLEYKETKKNRIGFI